MAVGSYGLAIEFYITDGEAQDSKAPRLIAMLPSADYITEEKDYDSEVFREQIRDKNTIPVIPKKKNFKVANDNIDCCLYKYRHLRKIFLLASTITEA